MSDKKLDLRMTETHDRIRIMCAGLKTIEQSGIRQDLIVLMLQDTTGLGKPAIRAMLNALPRLEKRYLK